MRRDQWEIREIMEIRRDQADPRRDHGEITARPGAWCGCDLPVRAHADTMPRRAMQPATSPRATALLTSTSPTASRKRKRGEVSG